MADKGEKKEIQETLDNIEEQLKTVTLHFDPYNTFALGGFVVGLFIESAQD